MHYVEEAGAQLNRPGHLPVCLAPSGGWNGLGR
jgi:hypothetical protein